MSRRLSLGALIAAILLATAVAGCGSEDDKPPTGSPVARHGPAAVSAYLAVEQARARLQSAGDLYLVGNLPDARIQLAGARSVYSAIAPQVAAADALLDREIRASFDRADELIARGGSINYRQEPTNPARERVGQLSGQLLTGALAELVPKAARDDAGLRAQVMLDLGSDLERTFAEGVRPRRGRPGLLAFQQSFGLLVRTQNMARSIGEELGPDRDKVIDDLSEVREKAFPLGIIRPRDPDEAAARPAGAALAVVRERFRLR